MSLNAVKSDLNPRKALSIISVNAFVFHISHTFDHSMQRILELKHGLPVLWLLLEPFIALDDAKINSVVRLNKPMERLMKIWEILFVYLFSVLQNDNARPLLEGALQRHGLLAFFRR